MTKVVDYMDVYYFKTWTRAAPYFIGIVTGWILHQLKGSKIALPKVKKCCIDPCDKIYYYSVFTFSISLLSCGCYPAL